VSSEFGTWHHGLIARWWAEFNVATSEELAYFKDAIRRFGEPALDLACGTGRILFPLLAEGIDVDGVDISMDMIALAQAEATKSGFNPRLMVQAMHELSLAGTYRTVYIRGSFGLGGRRDYDREALKRVYQHLEPRGALLITNHNLPYDDRWMPEYRAGIPGDWLTEGRRTASDGDEIELLSRVGEQDPLEQRLTRQIRARLLHGGQVVKEEEYSLRINIYFAQELLLMLDEAGFRDLEVQAGYTGRPATADDGMVAFVARK
jgi:SAM-dependent methyltransferase